MPVSFEQEAKRYREMAAAETIPVLADQLLGYAKEYEAWAAIIADGTGMAQVPALQEPQPQKCGRPPQTASFDET